MSLGFVTSSFDHQGIRQPIVQAPPGEQIVEDVDGDQSCDRSNQDGGEGDHSSISIDNFGSCQPFSQGPTSVKFQKGIIGKEEDQTQGNTVDIIDRIRTEPDHILIEHKGGREVQG